MNADTIGAIVGAIVTLSGGVAWWIKRRDAAKDPIPKSAAEVAMAVQLTGAAGSVVGWLQSELTRISVELGELRDRASAGEEAQERMSRDHAQALEAMRREHDQTKRVAAAAVAYVEALLRWAKAGRPVPIPDPPIDLHGTIDPSLLQEGAAHADGNHG